MQQKNRKLSPVALAAVAGLALSSAATAQNTLTSYTSSSNTNFVGPVLPNFWSLANPGAGSSTTDIRLSWMPGSFGHTINNDTGAVFTLNTLRLNDYVSGSCSLGTTGVSSFNFAGANARIVQEGWGTVSFSPSNITTSSGDLSLEGSGHGDYTFGGGGLGSAVNLNVNGNSGLINSQIISYSTSASGLAPVVLNSGNLRLSFTNALSLPGVPSVTINGGTLNLTSGSSASSPAFFSAPISINNGKTLRQTGGGTLAAVTTPVTPISAASGQNMAYTGVISDGTGAGSYTLSPTLGGAFVGFRNNMTYSGATTLEFAPIFGAASEAGAVRFNSVLLLDGANAAGGNASIRNTSSVNLRDGSTLIVQNGTATANDRINDQANLNLDGGSAYFNTGSATPYSETLKDLVLKSGTGTLTVGSNSGSLSGTNIALNFTNLTRSAGDGALFVRGGASTGGRLGESATGPRLLFANAPTNVVNASAPSGTVGVLPFVIGGAIATETGATTSNSTSTAVSPNMSFGLTRYDTNGVRLLNFNEYTNQASGTLANSNGNLRLNQGAATTYTMPASGDVSLNSLFINPTSGATTIGALADTSKLVFPSDAANLILINQSQSTTVNVGVDFGAEGKIYAANNSSATSGPNFNGVISGSSGLTIAGPGGINLSNTNTISGALTLDSARVGLTSAANLQNITSIVAGGSSSVQATLASPTAVRPRLQFNAPSAGSTLTLAQPVTLRSGLLEVINSQLSTSNNTTIELTGKVSGSGGLYVNLSQGGVTGSALRLSNTNNDYTGQTRIFGGTVLIASDAALGRGALDLASSSTGLKLEGDWTTVRQVNFSSSGTIDTNGFNASLGGALTSTGAGTTDTFFKAGNGKLTLGADSPLNMNITIQGGTLAINSTLGPTGTITANTGTTLGGSGTSLKNITMSAGSIFNPGSSVGLFTEGGSMTFNTTGTNYSKFVAEIDGAALANDQLKIFGGGTSLTIGTGSALTLTATSNALLDIQSITPVGDNQYYWLVINEAPVSGTSSGGTIGAFRLDASTILLDEAIFTAGGRQWQISYNGDFNTNNPRIGDSTTAGNDIVIWSIPAPSALPLLGLGGLIAARRRRV